MSQKLIEELNKENLCTHFILPLLKINKFSFVCSNFVDCFLTHDHRVVVKVLDKHFVHGKCILHPKFLGILSDTNYYYYVYSLPAMWLPDLKRFVNGKYSEMSDLAKDTIRVQSGLYLNKLMPSGRIETDARLLALEKHKVVKEMWERMIAPMENIQGELMSIPNAEKLYIQLDLLTPDTGVMPVNKETHM